MKSGNMNAHVQWLCHLYAFEHCDAERNERKCKPRYANTCPGIMLPCHAGTQCADAAANKQVEHEDGIAAVGGLWGLSQTAALVAKLVALCANIYQNDGGNESCISVSKQPGCSPSHKL